MVYPVFILNRLWFHDALYPSVLTGAGHFLLHRAEDLGGADHRCSQLVHGSYGASLGHLIRQNWTENNDLEVHGSGCYRSGPDGISRERRICQGLFTGTITASATLVAAGTPGRKLSYALGFLSSSTYIGFSFGPLLGGLAAELLGYRRSFFIGSIVIFTGFILVLLFIREIKTEVEAPVPEVRSFSLKALVMPPFVILFLLILLVRFCRTLPNPFIPLYVQEMRAAIQGTAAITGIIIASTGLATAVSGLTIARLGDRYNRVSLIGLFLGIASLSALPIFFTRSLLWFVLFFPLAFYFIGAVEPLLQSHLSANVPPRNRGILMGLQTTAGSIGWFLSPLTASAISIYLSIKHIFIFFSLSLFLTFLVIVVYRLRSVKTFRNV